MIGAKSIENGWYLFSPCLVNCAAELGHSRLPLPPDTFVSHFDTDIEERLSHRDPMCDNLRRYRAIRAASAQYDPRGPSSRMAGHVTMPAGDKWAIPFEHRWGPYVLSIVDLL